MEKFKIGDKVQILPTLEEDFDLNRVGVTSSMVKHVGEVATIQHLWPVESPDKWVYKLDIDGGAWNWTSRMFVSNSTTHSKRERNRSITF